MKNLTLILLAVVSMAFASCGGGKVKLADPPIEYATELSSNDYNDYYSLEGCLEVKDAALRYLGKSDSRRRDEADHYHYSVTVRVEVVKEPAEKGQSLIAEICLYDKNGAFLNSDYLYRESGFKKGEIISLVGHFYASKDEDLALKEIEDIETVSLKNVHSMTDL